MEQINRLMEQAVKDNVFPGGVLLVSKDGAIRFFEAYGYANIFSKRRMTKDTVFDLASLTKTLATTLAVMKLVQESELDIEQTLESVLQEFQNTEKGQIRIRHLLGHYSGLPDHRLYYERLRLLSPDKRRNALRSLLVKEPLIYPVGKKVIYSDLGFMILGWIVERVSGKRLDRFVDEAIYKTLGLENLFFVEVPPFPPFGEGGNSFFAGKDVFKKKWPRELNFAATELCPWRNILLEGIVHDDNACASGGIEGHAGLFGTAENIYILLSELLKNFQSCFSACVFHRDILKVFFERQKDTDRALGFDMPAPRDASCGRFFSKRSIGHLGFTGTSFWMDLDLSVFVILLTNRVHPSRDNVKIKAFRPELHDAVMKSLAITT
ncbi:serine hydrolase [Desulfococcaceae bacterium HSG8]|nr:serine hydrolase [Desulfococcaceae bacterium HSG8]